ncbi:MAG: flagellar FliJ family protein [Tepidanaerobacteraceae bacterium]|nr:flagellar FliJ family protein [Tepidanaerobacteraceae bacterium]
MRKFYFKLTTPLRIKQLREKIEKYKLAETIITKDTEENYLDKLKLINTDIRGNIKKNIISSVKIKTLIDYDTYSLHLLSCINAQKVVVEQTHEVYEKTRLSFLKARKEKQILERLKEKEHDDYFKEINREDQKHSDELANINYSRLERDVPNERYFQQ